VGVRLFEVPVKILITICYLLLVVSIPTSGFGLAPCLKTQERAVVQLSEEERRLRDELEEDTSILKMDCVPFSALEARNAKELAARSLNNRIRLALYDAARSGMGVVKAQRRCGTDEGDPVVSYMIVEQGKIKFVDDYSRDSFSSRRVYAKTCDKLVLGLFVENKDKREIVFRRLTDESKDKVAMILKCEGMQGEGGRLF